MTGYVINHYNSIKLVDVDDGRINDDYTPIKFIGRNYAGYGEAQNENFLWLLENFASAAEPTKKVPGMVWYDSSKRKLKFWDGSHFRSTGGAEVGTSPPIGIVTQGDLYYDTNARQMYVYDDTAGVENDGFILIGPQAVAGKGKTLFESIAVTDSLGNSRAVVVGYVNDAIAMVISTALFTLSSSATGKTQTLRDGGFSVISGGITLVSSTTGVTSNTDFKFLGTASDSDRLNGISYTEYVKRDGTVPFTGITRFNTDDNGIINGGLTVGTSSDLKLYVDTSNATIKGDYHAVAARRANIHNQNSGVIYFRTLATTADVDTNTTRTPFIIDGENRALLPGMNVTYDIGSLTLGVGTTPLRWRNIYAENFYGGTFTGTFSGAAASAANSDRLLIDNSPSVADPTFAGGTIWVDEDTSTHYRTAMTTATAWTIAARDVSGNLTANIFNGTATQARYADLAERYAADAFYEPGTVLVFGGEQEVTTTDTVADTRVAGVVSTAPAHLMNAEAGDDETYPAVALRGKIPVKVVGAVRKGDVLVTSFMLGYAEVAVDQMNIPAAAIIGKSLENKIDTGLGIVMVVV